MLIWTIEKDGLYFSQWGWSRSLDGSMRWLSKKDGTEGLAELREKFPDTLDGAKIVEREVQGTIARPRITTDYDPFGLYRR